MSESYLTHNTYILFWLSYWLGNIDSSPKLFVCFLFPPNVKVYVLDLSVLFWGTGTTIFLVGDGQTILKFGGNWHYKIFGRIVLRSILILFWGTGRTIFLVGWFAMGGDGQTVWIMTERLFWIWRKIFGRIVSRSKLRLFWGGWHHNIFGWCGKTVLNLAGTGTTKFSGGLFWGVNSDFFGGLAPQ